MQEIDNVHEQNFINAFRATVNETVSPIIDTFSGWLIGGFGAASAIIVGQYESVSKHIAAEKIQVFLYLFILALTLSIIQKFFSSIVIANAKGALAALKLSEEAEKKSIQLDSEVIFSELERSIFVVSRWAVKRSFKKAMEGDLVSGSRNFVRLSQIQGVIAFSQAVVTLLAISVLANNFHA